MGELGGTSYFAMAKPNVTCDRFYANSNKTQVINISGTNSYEGIPENLLINLIVWLVLIILFSILRKKAWDYGRIALVSRTETSPIIDTSNHDNSRYNVWTSLFYRETDPQEPGASVESLDKHIEHHDQGFCSWIPAFFRIKDEHILRKSGRDAVQYLTFQRYLIAYLSIICVCSIAVILPVNFQGDQEGTKKAFGHTTISNITPDSSLLWIHSVMAIGFLGLAVYFMRHFSSNLRYEQQEKATKTVMITHIPAERCFKNTLEQHFQEAYPEATVIDIQFAYNITKLVQLDKDRRRASEGRMGSEMISEDTGKRPTMVPYRFGQLCCCCESCGCQQVDAITYYTEEERKLRVEYEGEKASAFQEALGIAFVTFDSADIAQTIKTDFGNGPCKGSHNPSCSSVSVVLETHEWIVSYAPSPEDIYWENLSTPPTIWWIRAMIINGILVVILFFLTTPSIVMSSLDQLNYKQALQNTHNAFVSQFLPTILLWGFSALLPWVVYYSDQFVGHWTRTSEHYTVMRKTFVFLLLMVVILPSLGLTSAKAFLEYTLSQEHDKSYRWKCIFLPDNGAFFVNYVITSAFIGGALELIRFPELFWYIIKMLMARSAAEKSAVRKSVLWEFQFGQNYAWMLCVFTVTVVYSILSPLIVPFGLLYLVIKHFVDRYNIYFAYAPSKIKKQMHRSAISFVIVALILLQCNIFFFNVIRSSSTGAITIFTGTVLLVTLILYVGQIFFQWFKKCSPIRYKQFDDEEEPEEDDSKDNGPPKEQKPFIPSILLQDKLERERALANGGNTTNRMSYGTTQSMKGQPLNGDTGLSINTTSTYHEYDEQNGHQGAGQDYDDQPENSRLS